MVIQKFVLDSVDYCNNFLIFARLRHVDENGHQEVVDAHILIRVKDGVNLSIELL
jgi:hypothetical protein